VRRTSNAATIPPAAEDARTQPSNNDEIPSHFITNTVVNSEENPAVVVPDVPVINNPLLPQTRHSSSVVITAITNSKAGGVLHLNAAGIVHDPLDSNATRLNESAKDLARRGLKMPRARLTDQSIGTRGFRSIALVDSHPPCDPNAEDGRKHCASSTSTISRSTELLDRYRVCRLRAE
jgi:hypothetical protein